MQGHEESLELYVILLYTLIGLVNNETKVLHHRTADNTFRVDRSDDQKYDLSAFTQANGIKNNIINVLSQTAYTLLFHITTLLYQFNYTMQTCKEVKSYRINLTKSLKCLYYHTVPIILTIFGWSSFIITSASCIISALKENEKKTLIFEVEHLLQWFGK